MTTLRPEPRTRRRTDPATDSNRPPADESPCRESDRAGADEVRRSSLRQRLVDLERGWALHLRADGAIYLPLFAAAVTVVTGAVLGLGLGHWMIVVPTLTLLIMAGIVHQTIKSLTRALDNERFEERRAIVRMSAAAVSMAMLGSGLTILLVLLDHLGPLLGLR